MKEEMAPLKKLQELCREDLTKSQDFIKYSNLDECRMGMRLKTRMLDIAEDMPGKYKGNEGCVGCSPGARDEEGPEQRETRDHLELCNGYSHLWGGSPDNKEIINYFIKLMVEREDIKARK